MAKKYHKTRRAYKKGAKRLGATQVATRKEFKKVKAGLEKKYGIPPARKFTFTRTSTTLTGLEEAGVSKKRKGALRD